MKMYATVLTALFITWSMLIFSQVEIARPIESLESVDGIKKVDMTHVALAGQVEGSVRLKTLAGYYLSAENGGGGPVNATTSMPGNNTSFTIEDLNHGALTSGDQVKIRTSNGKLVFADEKGNVSSIYFITPGIEVFTIEKTIGSGPLVFGDVVCLKSSSGKYLSAIKGGGGEVSALAPWPSFTEAFVLTRPAPDGSEGEAAGEVIRTIEADGTIVFTYPDGTIKKQYEGGFTIIHPDGQKEIYSFMSGQPPTLPPAPGNTEQEWLEYHAEYLLNFIKSLVGHDEESINLYLSTEEGMTSIYEKIQQRTSIISKLLLP